MARGKECESPISDASSYEDRTREDAEAWCDRCQRRHGVVWFAPSDLWNATMREGDRGNVDEYGFCCAVCFMQLAEERGVVPNAIWRVAPAGDSIRDRLDVEIARMEAIYESHCRANDYARIVQSEAHLNGLKWALEAVKNG